VLVLAVRSRETVFAWTLAGALLLLAAFLVWLGLVAPVNGQIADAVRLNPQTVPALWTTLYKRWEYGHAAGFVFAALRLCGIADLVGGGDPAACAGVRAIGLLCLQRALQFTPRGARARPLEEWISV